MSIKHLPGRTEQELQATMKGLSPEEKLKTGAEQGLAWLVKDAIAAGADVHTNDDWALQLASYHGYVEVIKLLLSAGADVHATGEWACCYASYSGNVEVFKLLKKHIKNEHQASYRKI